MHKYVICITYKHAYVYNFVSHRFEYSTNYFVNCGFFLIRRLNYRLLQI